MNLTTQDESTKGGLQVRIQISRRRPMKIGSDAWNRMLAGWLLDWRKRELKILPLAAQCICKQIHLVFSCLNCFPYPMLPQRTALLLANDESGSDFA